jgi:hypothetical protein
MQALAHPRCPSEAIDALVRTVSADRADGRAAVAAVIDQLVAAAESPNCSADTLQTLTDTALREWKMGYETHYHYERLARQVVRHPSCPIPAVDRLCRDIGHLGSSSTPDLQILSSAINHPGCPPQLLREIRESAGGRLDGQLVLHPNCPPDLLVQWVSGDNAALRERAAANSNCPEEYRQLARVVH